MWNKISKSPFGNKIVTNFPCQTKIAYFFKVDRKLISCSDALNFIQKLTILTKLVLLTGIDLQRSIFHHFLSLSLSAHHTYVGTPHTWMHMHMKLHKTNTWHILLIVLPDAHTNLMQWQQCHHTHTGHGACTHMCTHTQMCTPSYTCTISLFPSTEKVWGMHFYTQVCVRGCEAVGWQGSGVGWWGGRHMCGFCLLVLIHICCSAGSFNINFKNLRTIIFISKVTTS
jgi:hypothetical protein